MTKYWPVVFALVGCASNSASKMSSDSAEGTDDGIQEVRLDVYPASDQPEALPQSLHQQLINGQPPILQLARSISIAGVLTGYEVTPWLGADLPGEQVSVESDLVIRREGSIQSYHLTSDEQGFTTATIVPGSDYTVSFLPHSPDVPFFSKSVDLTNNDTTALTLDLGAGVALWGLVTDEVGEPMAGVEVHAVDDTGAAGASATTDEAGLYSLRVQEGTYSTVATGQPGAPHQPDITISDVEVPDTGARVDIQYSALEKIGVGGGAVDEMGAGLGDVTVLLQSMTIDGYPEFNEQGYPLTAALSLVAETTNSGTWDARLLPGTWDIDLIPPAELAYTSLSVGEVSLVDATEFQPEELQPFVPLSGAVVGDLGGAAGARLNCTEVGYTNRHWSAVTDELGEYVLDLPATAVECVVSPPGSRPDLALTRSLLDPAADGDVDFSLQTGEPHVGTISLANGEPVAFATIEVRNPETEQLLAIALTDLDGNFTIQMPRQ
jgi:hypothetical protein